MVVSDRVVLCDGSGAVVFVLCDGVVAVMMIAMITVMMGTTLMMMNTCVMRVLW